MPSVSRTRNKKHISFFRLKFKVYSLKFNSAFTLIELLVVISIIAILLAVATVSYTNAQQKGRDSKRKSDLKGVQQALEVYYQANGKYPTGNASGQITCNTGTGSPPNGDNAFKTWGSIFSCDPDGTAGSLTTVTYMNPLPKENVFTGTNEIYFYENATSSTYKISAKIENTNDKEYCVSTGSNCVTTLKLPCEPASGRSYCVANP